MTHIAQRISALRTAMQQEGISAYIVPGTDPHAGEYIADYWKERDWISNFNGSAGTVAITLQKSGLWTDSRYFLQGAAQLEGTEIELMKQGLPNTLEIIPWLQTQLKAGEKVAVNPQMFSLSAYANMEKQLAVSQIQLVAIDLIAPLWTDRPALPTEPFFIFEEKYTGKSIADKLMAIRSQLEQAYANIFVTSALDDIAWMYNIRGADVSYNPVVISYAMVDEENAYLFVDKRKVTAEAKQFLEKNGVEIHPYEAIYEYLKAIPTTKSVLVDGNKLNQSLYKAIPTDAPKRIQMSPAFYLKSIKNETEIAGANKAMIKDGVALTKFFKWFEENLGKTRLTELSVTEKLHNFRKEQENFKGDSFNTICGYAGHGAIVHYSATPTSDAEIQPKGLLLIDSGGQYLDGTTDITRTIALSTPTTNQRTDYTLVLKGHIKLAMAQFPENTRGSQLDILARQAMWSRGINYGHGTGHGIGHFLNVHEGPQSIRMDENSTTLQAGMITSNEPGIYRTDEYGIRIENLILTVPATTSEFGQFYKFETLTLCYIDTTLIDTTLLTECEIKWFNEYQQTVYQKLSPALSEEERLWLENKCKPIQ